MGEGGRLLHVRFILDDCRTSHRDSSARCVSCDQVTTPALGLDRVAAHDRRSYELSADRSRPFNPATFNPAILNVADGWGLAARPPTVL